MTDPPDKSAARWGPAAREKTGQKFRSPIVRFPRLDCKPQDGLVGLYRRPRTHGEIVRAIANALRQEARLARQTGMNTPPEVLEDISSWATRGCTPA